MGTQKCASILAHDANGPNKSAVAAAICAISRKKRRCAQKFSVADDHRVAGARSIRLLTETDGAVS
ncbi:hypothetical protein [Mesorhizobium metallidurans]|uniref:hypothetical protein n=1 Tax=Mesorhizobium metallidurans TaxID=489722 RepID=UPI0005915E94|nr:hypothetical protein [Mesorhizobium metallidurans]